MYYRLDADVANMTQYWEVQNNHHVLTILGSLLNIDEDAIEIPFKFNISFSSGVDGTPKKQAIYDFIPSVNVMHKKLIDTLTSAGIDNLQVFPAQVTDAITGDIYNDYVVVNIIGMVSAVNLNESQSQDLADVKMFDKIVINSPKTHGHLIFRLSESQIEIVVAEKVANAIRQGNFFGVVLEALKEGSLK